MVNPTLLEHYNSEHGALSYQADHARKLHRKVSDRLERRLLTAYLRKIGPLETLLDLPCGAGRFYEFFQQYARHVVEADWSYHMLRLSRSAASGDAQGHVRCNGLQLPFQDRAFDCLASIRLNHHLDLPHERERHLAELLRVARKAVIVSWFSHHSFRAWSRRWRARLGGRKKEKYTMRRAQVARIAKEHGFDLQAARPLTPFAIGSSHVFGLLIRKGQ